MKEKENIGKLFDRIATAYDPLNHILSMNIDKLWRKRLARQMAPADEVLDVAIGTGDLAIEILRQGKAQHVLGIDLSEGMMEIGRKKTSNLPIDYELASALEMPYEADRFDCVTCSFGTRNFSDLRKGLSEMHRVLRAGGEVWILEFSYPSNKLVAWIYDLYFSHILPWVGGLISHDKSAYQYLNKSVKHFIWGEEYRKVLEEVGFGEVGSEELTMGIATLYHGKKSKA